MELCFGIQRLPPEIRGSAAELPHLRITRLFLQAVKVEIGWWLAQHTASVKYRAEQRNGSLKWHLPELVVLTGIGPI